MTSSWMLVAGFLFAAAAMFVKIGSSAFGAAELGFYRSLFTMVVAIVVIVATGGTVWSRFLGTHLLRGFLGALSLLGYFHAITQLPLALQPDFEEGKAGAAMVGLFSGVLAAWAYLSVRSLGRLGEPDWRTVFWFGAVATALCAAWQAATASFSPIRADSVWILLGLGVSGLGAQLAMTRAYRTGDTLVVGAFSYSAIVFGTIATVVVWNDTLSWLEWAGMAVIAASGIIAMRMEKREQIEEAGFAS